MKLRDGNREGVSNLWKRSEILGTMNNIVSNGKPVIGAAVGSGLSAKHAKDGGADFLLILNAGKFRSCGVHSIAAYMPFQSCNSTVMDLGEKEIIPLIRSIPVIFGACPTDPLINFDYFINKIQRIGFAGVNNFPTVCLLDGNFRQHLEDTGLGFDREVQFMERSAKAGLFTVAYVHSIEDAEKMARVDVDILCVNFGFTLGGRTAVKHGMTLKEAAERAQQVFNAATSIKPRIIKLVYGGPVANPDDFRYIVQHTDVQGYVGGSAIERLPVEDSISQVTSRFKSIYVLQKENMYLKQQLAQKRGFDRIVGNSIIMQELHELILKVADIDVNVLITGETGTGKDLVAWALHFYSKRNKGAFIKVNCAAIPSTLLESELFGHEKGAFTGAIQKRLGRFEMAHQGTLFLDEIGEMDPTHQAKLLTVIQQKEFERVGGMETIKVDVRIISATNRDLLQAIEERKCREDLYYRLNVVTIHLPPLRDRMEDIPALVSYFINDINRELGFNIQMISPDALEVLLNHNWPGNIRELKNVLERSAVLGNRLVIEVADLPPYLRRNTEVPAQPFPNPKNVGMDISQRDERQRYIDLLGKHRWNISKTAHELQISRKTLYKRLKNLGI
jgi:DNA-binding NtrC family response regulator